MEGNTNWLLILKQFLDRHPDIHFKMEVDPEGIDNDRNVYILWLIRGGTRVNVNGSIFDDIEVSLGALFEQAHLVFSL